MNTHSRQRHCKHDVTVARGSIERCVTCGAVLTNSENFAETVVKVLQSKNKGSDEMTDTENFSLGYVAWGLPTSTLRHAKAETSQPTPTEQLRAIAQAETAFNMCRKIDRMRMHRELTEEQYNADFPAIIAHVKALEAERDELRANPSGESDDYQGIDGLTDEEIDREVNYQLDFAQRRVEILTGELAAMQARAETAEHFARAVSGLPQASMTKTEVGQLIRSAQITLLFPSEKAGEA